MIKVDENLCIGCGVCESMCSKVFRIEDGKSKVVLDDAADCGCEVEDVVDACPVSAISKE
jgi:ferredoxin